MLGCLLRLACGWNGQPRTDTGEQRAKRSSRSSDYPLGSFWQGGRWSPECKKTRSSGF
jgi:hypothetical protein